MPDTRFLQPKRDLWTLFRRSQFRDLIVELRDWCVARAAALRMNSAHLHRAWRATLRQSTMQRCKALIFFPAVLFPGTRRRGIEGWRPNRRHCEPPGRDPGFLFRCYG